MGETGRSKILRMVWTDTSVQVYSFWWLVNDSTAAYKKLKNFLCSCSWRPAVRFGAAGFIWFTTIVLVLEQLNVWMGLPSASCKFQHQVTDTTYQERWGNVNYLNCSKSRSFWRMGVCKGEQWWKLNICGLKAHQEKASRIKYSLLFQCN